MIVMNDTKGNYRPKRPMRHDKLLFAMDDGDLPKQQPESQLQRCRRVMALTGRSVRLASAMTFNAAAARAATQRAQAGNERGARD